MILVFSGLFVVAHGLWRGYAAARSALRPLLREGDPTRTRVEAAQPVHSRARLRLAARQAVLAVVWLAISLYGLYLATVGMAVAS